MVVNHWPHVQARTVAPVTSHSPSPSPRRCVYNYMSDTDQCNSNQYTVIARGGAELDEVGAASGVSAIKSVHFTQSCTKPWLCRQLAVRGEKTGERRDWDRITFKSLRPYLISWAAGVLLQVGWIPLPRKFRTTLALVTARVSGPVTVKEATPRWY